MGFQGDINFGAALICFEKDDRLQTKPILTGIASRKHFSPTHDSPGMYTNIFQIKNAIQKKLGKQQFKKELFDVIVNFSYLVGMGRMH